MQFTVIKGGKAEDAEYEFVSGMVTDTRLMGVLGLHLHWKKRFSSNLAPLDLHYYLYYDVEEIGLDSIKFLEGADSEEAAKAEKASFGGLGAEMVELSERESVYLVHDFVIQTRAKHQMLPENIADISFMMKMPAELSEEEQDALDAKMCTAIKNDYQAVNYYLMRCFGKDCTGAKSLIADGCRELCEDIGLRKHATFLKNDIEVFSGEDGRVSYLCESLVESENRHSLVFSELEASQGKVLSAKTKKVMPISLSEASLLLSQGEYVTVYEVICPMEIFDMDFADYGLGMTKTEHNNGDLFMEFNPDNDHVMKQHFNLSDDIKAVYYSTDYGQLVVGAYNIDDINDIESKMQKSPIGADIFPTGRYRFTQSVVFEFATSNFTDFSDFINSMEK